VHRPPPSSPSVAWCSLCLWSFAYYDDLYIKYKIFNVNFEMKAQICMARLEFVFVASLPKLQVYPRSDTIVVTLYESF